MIINNLNNSLVAKKGASDDLSKGNVLVTEFIGYDGTGTGVQRSGIIKLTYGSYAAAEFVVTQEKKP